MTTAAILAIINMVAPWINRLLNLVNASDAAKKAFNDRVYALQQKYTKDASAPMDDDAKAEAALRAQIDAQQAAPPTDPTKKA